MLEFGFDRFIVYWYKPIGTIEIGIGFVYGLPISIPIPIPMPTPNVSGSGLIQYGKPPIVKHHIQTEQITIAIIRSHPKKEKANAGTPASANLG
ncbi:hypothetical protein D3OALGA1CA_4252 [Olavius algarvensis associated proteobacterium Delta 3]|nr:hypothetical protein D3OALGB2SA_4241 [Olavius algarvensis associated proteobacterium Delta 3]CAB5147943.1 hypothetical protein D3OALGA1CA_4252 [Olavius algarvensis associated proteobacterium Delta 3]